MSVPIKITLFFVVLMGAAWLYLAPRDTATSPAISFEIQEVSREIGIDFVHQKQSLPAVFENVEPFLAALGSSVAVVDIDRDGYQDLFFCNTNRNHPNAFYQNTGDGKFRDIAQDVGLANVNRPYPCMRPLFFDYNNDGRQDLFMTTMFCPKLFRQEEDGRFVDVSKASGISSFCMQSHASNVLDFDLDGDLDIVFSNFLNENMYDPKRYDFIMNHPVNATNGGPTLFLENNGDGTFSDITKAVGVENPGFVNSIGVYDFNYDMWPDLWFANDVNTNTVFINTGKGHFKKRFLGPTQTRSNMNSDVSDLDGDRNPVVFVTEIYEKGNLIQGNEFWKFSSDRPEVTALDSKRPQLRCGWSWGGKFIDLDNNGREDLVVASGFYSGDPNTNFWFRYMQIMTSQRHIVADTRNWPAFDGRSLAGHQTNCLFYNDNGNFIDISHQTPFQNFKLDGRGVAAIDYLNSGSLSFAISHQNQPAHFYKTIQKNENRWVGFELVGTKSNRDAIGTLVEIQMDSKTQTRQKYPMNAFGGQSDPRIHFGLGSLKTVSEVRIHWPSGVQQVFNNISTNRYYRISEGSQPEPLESM